MKNIRFPEKSEVIRAMDSLIHIAQVQNTPFAAALINYRGDIILTDYNTSKLHGPTAHAEMNLLRNASKLKIDIKELFLVSTCEPCPMCSGATIWSGCAGIYYGMGIVELSEYMDQIIISCQHVAQNSFRSPHIEAGISLEKIRRMFATLDL